MEAYERIVRLVKDVEDDVRKAEGGNKAAGTRVRKVMQEIRAAAQELRAAILQARDTGDAAAPTSGTAAPKPQQPKPGLGH